MNTTTEPIGLAEEKLVPKTNPDAFELWAESYIQDMQLDLQWKSGGDLKSIFFVCDGKEHYGLPGDTVCRTSDGKFYIKHH